ncbi:MAG: class I SAM-dependent methyltransferase [Rhodospirillales bacterium]|nr:class I SAM-dependent methyltransferase [Rhodospirillales bacterium]
MGGRLQEVDLQRYDADLHSVLKDRLNTCRYVQRGNTVLCLAARLGGEVRAFIDLGAFAVGIDLNPGPDNSRVLHGDFHNLVFADHSVDIVYCNSIDHAFDLTTLCGEIRRVLKPRGKLLLEIARQVGGPFEHGEFEAWAWSSTDEFVSLIEHEGFHHQRRTDFENPWPGTLLAFQPVAEFTGNATDSPVSTDAS